MMRTLLRKGRPWLIVFVLALTVVCDRMTKVIASTTLKDVPTKSYLYDTIRLQYVENEGAFLGLGGSLDRVSRFWVLTVGNASLLALISFWLWRQDSHRLRETLGLSLILAGGVANLLDRLFFEGRVVDFMNVGAGPLRTGIFNIADVAILAGAAVLLARFLGASEETP